MRPAPPERHPARWAPLSALFGAIVAFSAWVFVVRHAVPRNGSALERARELGLVSWTTLTGYDTGQEAHAWLLGCLLVPLGLWAGWHALRRLQPEVAQAEETNHDTPASLAPEVSPVLPGALGSPPPWVPWLAVIAVAASVFLRHDVVRGPNPWGSFGLLGEEGVYLGAVQAMRTGRTLYADLAFPYGPLLIQPFDLWLRVAGDTVVAARMWVLALQSIGIVVVACTVHCLTGPKRGPWAAAVAAIAIAAVCPPFLPVLNSALLRPALALLPAAVLHAAALGWLPQFKHPYRWAGASIAIAVLLSFEVGAVAVASSVVALIMHRAPREAWVRTGGASVAMGCLLLLPLTLQGGLGGFLAQAVEMIQLPSLGYQALPYPDLAGVFKDASGQFGSFVPEDKATRAWASVPPFVIWAGLGVGLCGLGRRTGHQTTGLFLAAVASALLFRGALGRSDLYHLWFYGAVPVVVLATLGFSLLWEAANSEIRAALPPLAALCLIFLVTLETKQEIAFPLSEEVRLATAAGIADPLLGRTIENERTGRLTLLPRLAEQVDAVTQRARALPVADGVWFYPSEAAYYYLSDRPVPMRYLWAYDAATPAMQRRAISELEASPPRWIFHSSDTFDIDHIPQRKLVPLLDAWIAQNYTPVQELPGATLLERVGANPEL